MNGDKEGEKIMSENNVTEGGARAKMLLMMAEEGN